ncbi:unnamed protein product [Rangifer tarandus platyrhynchus]|uniref:Uncharacterized protein n=2 Tax=Rangifer tarandus platyrhynchus TaxID=3082113 RepID=A0ABN8ZIV8_RANTA|nr:unnamed protein product [Rangifer tarandus platyrhynchus]
MSICGRVSSALRACCLGSFPTARARDEPRWKSVPAPSRGLRSPTHAGGQKAEAAGDPAGPSAQGAPSPRAGPGFCDVVGGWRADGWRRVSTTQAQSASYKETVPSRGLTASLEF